MGALAMSATGSNLAVAAQFDDACSELALTVTGLTGTNGHFLLHRLFTIVGGNYDAAGHLSWFTSKQISSQSD